MLLKEDYTKNEVQDIFEDMLWQFSDFEDDIEFDRDRINHTLGWLSNNNRKTLGRCHWDGWEYNILLNPNMLKFQEDGINTIKNTIAHELCHTLPGCMNHGKNFHARADQIGFLMGYVIDTHADTDSSAYFRKYLPDANYKVICSNCGHEVSKSHLCNAVRNPSRYRCGKCGSTKTLSSYKLNKATGEYELFRTPDDEVESKYSYVCPDCGWVSYRPTRNQTFKWHEALLATGRWLSCPKCDSHNVYILDNGKEIHKKEYASSYTFTDDDEEYA